MNTLESSLRIEQRHQTQTIKERLREGCVHVACATVPPRPALVASRAPCTFFRQPRLHQVLGAGIQAFPLPPQDAAQFVPDPAIHFFQRLLGLGQPKVGHPAAKDQVEFGDDCRQVAPSRAFEYFTDFAFQPLIAGWRYAQSRGLVPSQAVAQELPLPRMRYRALGRIDRELERKRASGCRASRGLPPPSKCALPGAQ